MFLNNKEFSKFLDNISLYLPAKYFNVDESDKVIVKDEQKYLKVNPEDIQLFSFETNRIKFDYEWYDDFVIKIEEN